MSPEPKKRHQRTDLIDRVAGRFNRLVARGYDSAKLSPRANFLVAALGAASAVALTAALVTGRAPTPAEDLSETELSMLRARNEAPTAMSGRVGFQAQRTEDGRVIDVATTPEQEAILLDERRQDLTDRLFKIMPEADLSIDSVRTIQRIMRVMELYDGSPNGIMDDPLRAQLVALIAEDVGRLRQVSTPILYDLIKGGYDDTLRTLLSDDQKTWDKIAERLEASVSTFLPSGKPQRASFQTWATVLGLYNGPIDGRNNKSTNKAQAALSEYLKTRDTQMLAKFRKDIAEPTIPDVNPERYSALRNDQDHAPQHHARPSSTAPSAATRHLMQDSRFMQAILNGNNNRAQIYLERLDRTPLILKIPVQGNISSGFGARAHPVKGYRHLHPAIDIPAPTGTPIHAFAPGRVLAATAHNGYGNVVILDHGRGMYSLFAHMHRLSVRTGDTVKETQPIGTVGKTGEATGPHLHFEFMIKDDLGMPRRIDIAKFINHDFANPATRRAAIADAMDQAKSRRFHPAVTTSSLALHYIIQDNKRAESISPELAYVVHEALRQDTSLVYALPARTLHDLRRHGYNMRAFLTAQTDPAPRR